MPCKNKKLNKIYFILLTFRDVASTSLRCIFAGHKLFQKMSLCLCYSVVWLLVDDPAVKTEGFWEREMFSQLAKRSKWKAVFKKTKEMTIDGEDRRVFS